MKHFIVRVFIKLIIQYQGVRESGTQEIWTQEIRESGNQGVRDAGTLEIWNAGALKEPQRGSHIFTVFL
ncbi:hypothetical protein KKD49_19345 [Myxococcota bacterium]|nr:hypothetical protein [Myxococcota bacterium]